MSICKSCGSVHCQNYQHCQDYQNKTEALKEQLSRLRKRIGKDYNNENKRLETENKALKDRDELRASILVKFQDENKELKAIMDKLLGKLKEVESTGYLPDGDSVNLSTEMWLEKLIQKTEKEIK